MNGAIENTLGLRFLIFSVGWNIKNVIQVSVLASDTIIIR